LLKSQIIEELRKRGVEFDEAASRDDLRKQLVDLVKLKSHDEENPLVIPIQETSGDNNVVITEVEEMTSDTKIYFKESDDWEAFSERLEFYFLTKKITEGTMKRAELLTHIDEGTYKLVKALCAPGKPVDKSFDELVKLLTDHLKPGSSELMARCKFNQAKQEATESVTGFAKRLRQLSTDCNFGSNWEKSMQVQFTMGIRDELTRFEFFKSKDITFAKALEEALAREKAAKNSFGVAQTLASKVYKQDTFAISRKKIYQGRAKYSKNKQDKEPMCYCCGKTGHETSSCKYRDKKCNICHKTGHLERACITKKNLSNKFNRRVGCEI